MTTADLPVRPSRGEAHVDALVIGGGMAGLSAADVLRTAGCSVRLLEAGASVGGLARAVEVGGEPIEAYYHHVFPQDRETIELAERLGMGDRLEWLPGSMAILHDGAVHPFDSPLDLLRFTPLPVLSRLRVGLATLGQVMRRDRHRLDRRTAAEEAGRWFGRPAYGLLWRPLLEAKFGDRYHDQVAMAWLVARIRQRAGSRGARGDRLGYLRGSLGTLASAYGDAVRDAGVQQETGARVSRMRWDGHAWHVAYERDGETGSVTARAVVAALAGPVLERLVDLPPDYLDALAAIPYRGVVCVLLELDRPLGPHYWVNVTDSSEFACVAIIEHTNLVPAARYGGRSVVYLAHYVDREGPVWDADADELVAAAEPYLRAVQPAFSQSWIRATHISRDPFAQPVPLAGGPMPSLPVATGLPSLSHASLAHIYPHDRGVAQALRLGRRAADEVLRSLAALS